jgi:acyl-coenzyme A thioesterase PaaI-like protein
MLFVAIAQIKADCLRLGNKLAYTSMEIRNASDGKLIAVGRHTKAV